MRNHGLQILLLAGILLVTSYELLVTDCNAQEESITITTYYPSPYGVYRVLRLYPNDDFTLGSACTDEGEMYYDQSDHTMYVCSGSPSTWQVVPTSPACTFCLSCGGQWPNYQGSFSTDDDSAKNIEVARGNNCSGDLQQNPNVGVPISLCCR